MGKTMEAEYWVPEHVREWMFTWFDFTLARNVASYRKPVYSERRLLQVADYLTPIELAAVRFDQGRQSRTYERFFGARNAFKRNLLKPARRLQAE